jgi:hypothetical protein
MGFTQADARLESAHAQAKKCAKALIDGEIDTVIDFMPEKVIEQGGGRDALIAAAKQSMEAMKKGGISLQSAEIGTTKEIQGKEKNLYCLVPQTIVMTISNGAMEGTLTSESFLLGFSVDEGKSWKFLDVAPGEAKLREIFPEVPATLKFPERKQPKFTPKATK